MFISVEQGTDAWFDMRLKISTGSNFSKIMAHHDAKTPKWGDPAIKYARQKATERVTGVRNTSGGFKNRNMERGNELEPMAIRYYERETLYSVSNGGIFISEDSRLPKCSDSPDGLVGKRGCIEVKSVIENTQWVRIENGGYDTAYKWQICAHMLLADREWCDFVQFCPEMPENKRLYIFRVHRDEDMINRLCKRLNEFEKLIVDKYNLIK